MMAVAEWVKDLVAGVDVGFVPLEVGQRYKLDGRLVEVIDGRYWGEHGISNFWYWRPVLADGSLGELEHGYGNKGSWVHIPADVITEMVAGDL